MKLAREKKVNLEPMKIDDLAEVIAIENQVFTVPWSYNIFLDELTQENRVYFVARVDKKIVGYVGLFFFSGEGHITTLAVDPLFQRRGLARLLLIKILTEAIERGLFQLSLEVRASNIVARHLYEKFGFEVAYVRQGYYTKPVEDALVMILKNLNDPEYKKRLIKWQEEIL